MQHYLKILIILGLLCAAPIAAFAKKSDTLHIFACEPEWGALAKEIGGAFVNVYTATKAYQDAHHMRAKPSLLAAMRKSDLVFCSGASLESGWLPLLVEKAGGPNVQQHTEGWFMASDFVEKLEVMTQADRSMGHVHPEGNPHIHLNPHNLVEVAHILAERLYLLDKDNSKHYEANLQKFKAYWKTAIANWEKQSHSLKNTNVIVYHKNWAYLTDWLGINIVESLEPKPGLPPTTSHLSNILEKVKTQKIQAILVAPFENDDAAKWLAERSNIPVLYLPYTVGGTDTAGTLENLFEETLSSLLEIQK